MQPSSSLAKRTVEVDSRPGKGTRFRLTFPPTAEAPSESPPSHSQAAPGQETDPDSDPAEASGLTILLAEDDPLNARVGQAILERAGCSVVLAENGLQALEAVRREHFDAVLMDMHMPEMDGFQATRLIRQGPHAGDVPIIALTASDEPAELEACLEAGMNAYLHKPMNKGSLTAILRQMRHTGEGRSSP